MHEMKEKRKGVIDVFFTMHHAQNKGEKKGCD
jgi:hypothetical protein